MNTSKVDTANPWFGVSMALVGVIVGYALASVSGGVSFGGPSAAPSPVAVAPSAPTPTPEAPSAGDMPEITDEDYVRGDEDAPVTIVEYSDFECPFCARHHPTMVQLVDDYAGKVNWIYRHYPLSFHPNAQKAAEASECAGELGGNDAFWKMADLLIEKGVSPSSYEGYATEIGINAASFKTCLDSGKYAQKIADQMDGGSAAGVSGTPGNIIVNNKTGETRIVSGAQQISAFKTVIDTMLQ